MRDVEVFDDAAAFRAAQRGTRTKRTKQGTTATTSEPGQGDQHAALGRLATLGYMPRWRAGVGFDFWSTSNAHTTPACATYADAVRAAEQELRER